MRNEMDKYADLRALLSQQCNAVLIDDPGVLHALLADYDRMRVALTTIKKWPVTSALNMDAHNMQVVAHAALSGESNG